MDADMARAGEIGERFIQDVFQSSARAAQIGIESALAGIAAHCAQNMGAGIPGAEKFIAAIAAGATARARAIMLEAMETAGRA